MSGIIVLPSNMPVGFRFHPTDEELISHYLRLKLLGRHAEVDPVIAEVDFFNSDPLHLPSMSKIESEDQVWWFFCRRDRSSGKTKRAKRKTESGFWKVTGLERKIKAKSTKPTVIIGTKRTLVFYMGSSPGKRTNWVMQEFCLHPDQLPIYLPHTHHQQMPDYVICRLKLKSDNTVDTPNNNNGDEGEPSGETSDPITPMITIPAAELGAEARDDIVESSIARREDKEPMSLFRDDQSEEYSASQFADSLIVDPDENYCRDRTKLSVSEISSLLITPSKRAYSSDSDNKAEGGDEPHVQTRTRGETSHVLLPLLARNSKTRTVKLSPGERGESSVEDDGKRERKLGCEEGSERVDQRISNVKSYNWFNVVVAALLFAVFARQLVM